MRDWSVGRSVGGRWAEVMKYPTAAAAVAVRMKLVRGELFLPERSIMRKDTGVAVFYFVVGRQTPRTSDFNFRMHMYVFVL